jgi:hypothetical protein
MCLLDIAYDCTLMSHSHWRRKKQPSITICQHTGTCLRRSSIKEELQRSELREKHEEVEDEVEDEEEEV